MAAGGSRIVSGLYSTPVDVLLSSVFEPMLKSLGRSYVQLLAMRGWYDKKAVGKSLVFGLLVRFIFSPVRETL